MSGEPAVRIDQAGYSAQLWEGPDSVGAPSPEARLLPGPPAPPPSSLINGMCMILLNPGLDSDEELGLLCHHTSYLDQRVASFCTLTDMHPEQDLEGAQELPLCVDPGSGKDFMDATGGRPPSTLTGKVNQLELILRQLQTDLRKEKQDKAVLQAEVQHLRQDNLRLQEESQTAAAQLRKFTEWFFNTVDKKPTMPPSSTGSRRVTAESNAREDECNAGVEMNVNSGVSVAL
ncbi:hypothetical protein J1605_005767 [Eschrichtius robustus]|uniref:Signal-induced proliferation-associated 1-like protein C-terminal domain-containing protein n=1 Tax=Eschrichtius robustus TaxID=9764 RepID=A0AB34H7F9_ESCRO|nr:hypothetical protein J1605_005767 [Eschrichtius robustus]